MTIRHYGKTVERAIAEIAKFHAAGRRSLEEHPGLFHPGEAKKAGTQAGMSSERLSKARMFGREFTKTDLNRLCREIETGGFPVGVEHVIRLMRLPAHRRWKFLRQTIEQKWSCRQLADAIQRVMGRRSAGRTPSVRDREEAADKLLMICEKWKRLVAVIMDGSRDGMIAAMLPPSLDGAIRRCDQAVQRLHGALQRFRKS